MHHKHIHRLFKQEIRQQGEGTGQVKGPPVVYLQEKAACQHQNSGFIYFSAKIT